MSEIINGQKNKTFSILEMEKEIKKRLYIQSKSFDYRSFANAINELEREGKIKPIVASKMNGMFPALFRKYSKVNEIEKIVDTIELLTNYHPQMNLMYFKTKNEEYQEKKYMLKAISEFLYTPDTKLLTVNERSLELFEDEKFLESTEGKKFLSNIGVSIEKLVCEKTFEPFFYVRYDNHSIKNVLIIENKDTFYSIKSLMREGINTWGNTSFQLLIYGEGNKITKSIEFIQELNLPTQGNVFYFGDIDREGLTIKHSLNNKIEQKIHWMDFF